MQFDYTHDTANCQKLSPATADMMRATRNHWRKLGQSVQFYSDAGKLDEWSFSTKAQLEAFIAKNLNGKPFAVSA
jgi:hypothetical protein